MRIHRKFRALTCVNDNAFVTRLVRASISTGQGGAPDYLDGENVPARYWRILLVSSMKQHVVAGQRAD
jgi:hypothetical protein